MALRRINLRKRPLLLPRPFSSSSSPNPPFPPPPPPPNDRDDASRSPPKPGEGEGRNPATTLFQDMRYRLMSTPSHLPSRPRRIPTTPPPRPTGHAPPVRSIDDIRRQLESYHGPLAARGASPGSPDGAAPSFLDLLKSSSSPTSPQGPNAGRTTTYFASIAESLSNLPRGQQPQQQRQTRSSTPFLAPTKHRIFGRELRENARMAEGKEENSFIELKKEYSWEELGKKLGQLRPSDAGKDGKEWFSLEELQGRIAKLADLDTHVCALRSSIQEMAANQKTKDDIKKIKTMQALSYFANIGGPATPQYLQHPPQEELLERYFHPDHMSSEEKMKLELQRVRDEFKMSENDCGSARVQIAQLTVKIKHLSTVLHKKDKHSRKGLQDMVQRRKKYLKYLRRTDWDSYCLVLSKLGLRDVPEYKAPDYKNKSTSKAKSKKSKSKKRKMKA
uniref:Small ribosomal subunit protein uS15c n=1 Tax=Oryza punctata TaxID=4537 RepID=A0A0E0K6F6_ORYPU